MMKMNAPNSQSFSVKRIDDVANSNVQSAKKFALSPLVTETTGLNNVISVNNHRNFRCIFLGRKGLAPNPPQKRCCVNTVRHKPLPPCLRPYGAKIPENAVIPLVRDIQIYRHTVSPTFGKE